MDINPRIAYWFERGKILEALVGKGTYFIPEITYREEHDTLLVIQTLSKWATTKEKILAAQTAFFDAIKVQLANDPVKAFDLVFTYFLVSEDAKVFPIDKFFLTDLLRAWLTRGSLPITSERLRILVMKVERYIPEIRP